MRPPTPCGGSCGTIHHCSGPCGEDDLGIDTNSIFYATGFVTDMDGTANATARLDTGPLPKGIDVLIPGGLHSTSGLAAEIHIIVRAHGIVVPGMVDDQIGTFNGACDPGPNTCEDQQAAVFAPLTGDGCEAVTPGLKTAEPLWPADSQPGSAGPSSSFCSGLVALFSPLGWAEIALFRCRVPR